MMDYSGGLQLSTGYPSGDETHSNTRIKKDSVIIYIQTNGNWTLEAWSGGSNSSLTFSIALLSFDRYRGRREELEEGGG